MMIITPSLTDIDAARNRCSDPFGRNDLLFIPNAIIQIQIAELGHIAGRHFESPTPIRNNSGLFSLIQNIVLLCCFAVSNTDARVSCGQYDIR